jgi:hypothetical protein
MKTLLTLSFLAALAATGCFSEESGYGYTTGYASVSPGLVYVSPGVQVIADYDYPVFYSDNYYWRYDNGLWYRSGGYNGGWVAWGDVPYGVRSINQPYNYVHYRGNAQWGRGTANDYRSAPVVRDHREGGYQPAYRSQSQPVYRQPAPAYQGRSTYSAPSRGPTVRDHR